MPELPEVETTRRMIAPLLEGKKVDEVVVRKWELRLPVPHELSRELSGQTILRVERRGKYLLLRAGSGCVILHLGMSGRLSIVGADTPPGKHDHLDILMAGGMILRLNDPRRFGLALWTRGEPLDHPLLASLGPEPLQEGFDGSYLFRVSRDRILGVKEFIMGGRIVAGVGNIYANEALFRAGIHPATGAGTISLTSYKRLADALREVLNESIELGASLPLDLSESRGKPAYFPLSLDVYGREGEPCRRCGSAIRVTRQKGRSTYFCIVCQKQ